MVTKPQNVLVMRDVAAGGYVAGNNILFFSHESTANTGPRDYSLQTAQTNMQKRLGFTEGNNVKYSSMLSFPAWEEQVESKMDSAISVTSRLLPWEVNAAGMGNHNSFPGGQAVYEKYAGALNLRQIHFGEDMKAAENHEYLSQGTTNNALCFLGPHRRYNPFTKSFMELIPGQGHWGPDAIPGVRAALSTIATRLPSHTAHPPRVAGRPLASRRVGVAARGAQLDDGAGARPARPDGVPRSLDLTRDRMGTPSVGARRCTFFECMMMMMMIMMIMTGTATGTGTTVAMTVVRVVPCMCACCKFVFAVKSSIFCDRFGCGCGVFKKNKNPNKTSRTRPLTRLALPLPSARGGPRDDAPARGYAAAGREERPQPVRERQPHRVHPERDERART